MSKRVSANAVGRRGHFPEGRVPPDFHHEAPPGNAPSGFALARIRRPGLENRKAGKAGPGTEAVPVDEDIDDEGRGFDDTTITNNHGPFDLGADEFLGDPDSIFSDGFESGDTTAWSSSIP